MYYNVCIKEVASLSIKYENNEQILIEIKKLLLESKTTQKEIADKLGIKPQGLTKLMNKKNFGFEDAKKILSAMGYELMIDFKKIESHEPSPKHQREFDQTMERDKALLNNELLEESNISDTKQKDSPNKQYKQLTDSELSQIDFKRLVKDVLYQIEIGEIYGEEVLPNLLEYARQQLTDKTAE